MPRLLSCGIVTWDWLYRVDRIPPGPGAVEAKEFVGTGGGMAASAACAMGRLGGDVEFWGRCGDDRVGDEILADMRGYGVRVDRVRRIAGYASPVSAILIDRDGERMIVPYYDPALDQDPSWLPVADMPLFDGVMVDARWPRGAARALDAARAAGAIAMLDADVAPREILDDLMARATHVVWSEAALADWSGSADPQTGLREARRRFAGFLGVTVGAAGFRWLEGDEFRGEPAPSTRSPPATSSTAPSCWRLPRAGASRPPRASPMSPPRSNAAASAVAPRRRAAPRSRRSWPPGTHKRYREETRAGPSLQL
jgi:sulfofructose kinase